MNANFVSSDKQNFLYFLFSLAKTGYIACPYEMLVEQQDAFKLLYVQPRQTHALLCKLGF